MILALLLALLLSAAKPPVSVPDTRIDPPAEAGPPNIEVVATGIGLSRHVADAIEAPPLVDPVGLVAETLQHLDEHGRLAAPSSRHPVAHRSGKFGP